MSFLGQYPVNAWLRAFAQVGGLFWRLESRTELNGTRIDPNRDADGVSLLFGLGLRANFGKSLSASLTGSLSDVDDEDIFNINAGFGFRF